NGIAATIGPGVQRYVDFTIGFQGASAVCAVTENETLGRDPEAAESVHHVSTVIRRIELCVLKQDFRTGHAMHQVAPPFDQARVDLVRAAKAAERHELVHQ